jgi:hypothetical protein
METPIFVYPPEEAFRYWPPDDLKLIGSKEKCVRFIFYNTTFSPFENQILSKFESHLKTKHSKLKLPDYMTREELLRMLHARRFDFKKATECLMNYIQWREAKIPNGAISLYPKIEHLLSTGAIYIHGRDHRYRPLLVLNLERLMRHSLEVDDCMDLICFQLQYVTEFMMIPG